MSTRQASDFERGLLVGSMIASMMPNTLMLFLFLMVICYDLGRPRIIEVFQKTASRVLGIDFESDQLSQLSQLSQNIQNLQTNSQNQGVQNLQNQGVQQPFQQTNQQLSVNNNLPANNPFANIPNQTNIQNQTNVSPSQQSLYQQSSIPGALGFGLNLLNQQLSASTQQS